MGTDVETRATDTGCRFRATQRDFSSQETSLLGIRQVQSVLKENVDVNAFARAWKQVVMRYGLRLQEFPSASAPGPFLCAEGGFVYSDWRAAAPGEREKMLAAWQTADRELGLPAAEMPCTRAALIQMEKADFRFVWLLPPFSHRSLAILLQELLAYYEAFRQECELELNGPYSFPDGLGNGTPDWAGAEKFWRGELQGFGEAVPLTFAEGNHGKKGERRGEQVTRISERMTSVLVGLCRRNGISLEVLVQAAWGLLLSRYCGREDIVFGAAPDMGEAKRPAIRRQNLSPVRLQMNADATAGAWLKQIQQKQEAARPWQDVPLEKILSWSEVADENLFQTVVAFQQETGLAELQEGQQRQFSVCSEYGVPLWLEVSAGTELSISLGYDRTRCDDDAMRRMIAHLKSILENLGIDMQQNLREISPLTEEERHLLLVEWNKTRTEFPRDKCVHELFEAQAARTPDATAVVCRGRRLSYRQLNARADLLAAHLRSLGVGPEIIVGVCLDRSVDLIAALFGILKAGGAYVPLDPAYPGERLAFMLEDTQAPVLVTDRRQRSLPRHEAKLVCLDEIFGFQEAAPETPAAAGEKAKPANLAYVIYTSGSTGKPKGVLVTHHNLANSTQARMAYYKEPVAGYLMLSSCAFDSSVAGIFWTLCQGGKLVLSPDSSQPDPSELADLIAEEGVSHLLCLPSLYSHILESDLRRLATLRTVIVAGESCPSDLIERHRRSLPHAALFNEYGPTEATVWSTVFDCRSPLINGRVPIGRPIANSRVYLLDHCRKPVPVWVTGEIYIGGEGVASGYLNRPELTAERFVADPFSRESQGRLYKTGDLGRYLPDGTIEFLGRADQQVKVRGYRIEPEEIEIALRAHEAVADVVVETWDPARYRRPVSGDGESPDQLGRDLAALGPEQAEALLQQVEGGEPERRTAEPAESRSPGGAQTWSRRSSDFEIWARLNRPDFIHPPRESQRNWLLNRAVAEMADDLAALDELARRFVPGADPGLELFLKDRTQSVLEEQEILEDWHIPLMKAMARAVTDTHGDLLEIGFGRGVASTFLQECGVRSHTIIECNDSIITRFFEPWRRHYADRDIRLVRGRWQDVIDALGEFDAIFFQTYPLNQQEFDAYLSRSVAFAEHFFPTAARHLRAGGAFTYLTHEIDSLSRRHQRLILRYFRALTLSIEPLHLPRDCRDLWWADSMAVVKAVK